MLNEKGIYLLLLLIVKHSHYLYVLKITLLEPVL